MGKQKTKKDKKRNIRHKYKNYEHKLLQNNNEYSKEVFFCFVFVNLRENFIFCYFAYAYVAILVRTEVRTRLKPPQTSVSVRVSKGQVSPKISKNVYLPKNPLFTITNHA